MHLGLILESTDIAIKKYWGVTIWGFAFKLGVLLYITRLFEHEGIYLGRGFESEGARWSSGD